MRMHGYKLPTVVNFVECSFILLYKHVSFFPMQFIQNVD
jgi:hypothetical protein